MKLVTLTIVAAVLFTSCEKKEAVEVTQQETKPIVKKTLLADSIEQQAEPVKVEKTEELELPAVESQIDTAAIRQECRRNLTTIQNATQSFVRIYGLSEDAPLQAKQLKGILGKLPVCPLDKAPYNYTDKAPTEGSPYATCPHGH